VASRDSVGTILSTASTHSSCTFGSQNEFAPVLGYERCAEPVSFLPFLSRSYHDLKWQLHLPGSLQFRFGLARLLALIVNCS